MEVGHANSIFSELVESWSMDLTSVWTDIREAEVVGDDDQEAWSLRCHDE